MQVDLFYLSPNSYGGWVTYTSHLMKSLRAAGVFPLLYKIGSRHENSVRPFGYGENYQNTTLDTIQHSDNPKIIVAAAKNFQEQTKILWERGAALVVHDPTELKNLPPDIAQSDRVVVVRKVGLEYLPKATFIRHPYCRVQYPELVSGNKLAVSVSRVDFDKHTKILLDANRMLALMGRGLRINIRGFENRIYTRFNIVPHYPEWIQSKGHFPRNADEAFKLLQEHLFHVDMSEIKGDGGGTQYTFLEAWDAGAVNVINSRWLLADDDMKHGLNCLAVQDARELTRVLAAGLSDGDLSRLRNMGYAQLALHHPVKIGEQYRDFLKRL